MHLSFSEVSSLKNFLCLIPSLYIIIVFFIKILFKTSFNPRNVKLDIYWLVDIYWLTRNNDNYKAKNCHRHDCVHILLSNRTNDSNSKLTRAKTNINLQLYKKWHDQILYNCFVDSDGRGKISGKVQCLPNFLQIYGRCTIQK